MATVTVVVSAPLASRSVTVPLSNSTDSSTFSTIALPLVKFTVLASVSAVSYLITEVWACPCGPVVLEASELGVTGITVGV